MVNMVRQSDLEQPKSPEECDSRGNTDDEFEEYSEEEILSEEESNEKLMKVEGSSCTVEQKEDGSFDEESAEVSLEEDSVDDDSCAEGPHEPFDDEPAEDPTEGPALEEASGEDPEDASFEEIIEEEFSEEDASFEEIIEEEFSEEDEEAEETVISEGVPLPEEGKILSESKTSTQSFCNQESTNLHAQATASMQPDAPLDSTRKRRTRWDITADDIVDFDKKRKTGWSSDEKAEALIRVNDNADLDKKRKTRWSSDEPQPSIPSAYLPDSVRNALLDTCNDQQIQRLNAKLHAINQKIDRNLTVNKLPQGESSSSPSPVDDGLASRIQAKAFQRHLKLLKQKHKIISELLANSKKINESKLPSMPTQWFSKKLYIPSKIYPSYNFVGLLLGPKGNSLKKMEKETGATIRIRGKDSNTKKKGPEDQDDIHVLIEAGNQNSFDSAVSMVEKLLIPVDDQNNYYKDAQLRELAEIRGTLIEGKSVLVKPCDVCGTSSHPTCDCPLTATDSQLNINLNAASGGLFSSFKSSSLSPCSVPSMAITYGDSVKKEIDPSNLFVGCLPQSVSSDKLMQLFQPYGNICSVTVLIDKSTGRSKGCGFVKYIAASDAAMAIEKMNGHMIDGMKLTVRIAGIFPISNANPPNHPELASILPSNIIQPKFPGFAPVRPPLPQLPIYPGHFATPQEIPEPNCLLGPPGSSFPELGSYNSLSYTGSAPLPSSTIFGSAFQTMGTLSPSLSPSLNVNLLNYPGFAAIPREMPEPNCWPGPPGSMLPESGISSAKSSYNSLTCASLQAPTSLGSTLQTSSYMMDRKKLELNATETPLSSSNANLQAYRGFSATSWPVPPCSMLPEPAMLVPKSSYDSLKHSNCVPSSSSTNLGSTCQPSISLSRLTHGTPSSDELASFPGYLKSIDPSDQFDQSISSQSPYFMRTFPGNPMNPSWR